MDSLLIICVILGVAGVGAAWLYDVSHQDTGGGWRLMWSFAMLPFTLVGLVFRGARYGLESADVSLPAVFGPRRVRNPESVELVKRKTANPARPAGASHGSWPIMGKAHEAVHCVVVGEPGSAKGQNIVNHTIRHQLQHSPEHLIIIDVKPELEAIVRRYARPDDRIFLYTSHAKKKKSSALNLFSDIDQAGDVAEMLTQPDRSKDPYWSEKAADLIEADARYLHRSGNGGAVSLGEIADTVADRGRLNDLRDRDPLVDNVADNSKEWGSIRSNASRAVAALKIDRVRRTVDPLPKTTQPTFGLDAPRTIVLIQPSEELADRLEALIASEIHALYHLAASGGWAGGAGTKVIADEAASFMALHRLPRYLEIGRGRKVQMMYVLQSRKQLVDVLGEDRADRTLASTELQIIGATSDLGTADFLERLSGPGRVHYRGPRNPDGERPWTEHMRPMIQSHEITSQGRGDWTIRHHAHIAKYHVPDAGYYFAQPHPEPQPLKVHGIPKR